MLLAFETSAKAAGVALMDGGILLGESYQNTGLTHSQTIMAMAQDLIAACGYTPQDIQAVTVAAGPGYIRYTQLDRGASVQPDVLHRDGLNCRCGYEDMLQIDEDINWLIKVFWS